MEINPVIHHHFEFSSAILHNTEYCQKITFKSIPFFKLYEMKDRPQIRNVIDTLSIMAMPHNYQYIINDIAPPEYLRDCDYRNEEISMTYCEYNRQSFFVRAYRIRSKPFFKVEVILHSDTLGKGKNFTFEKALRGAQSFFRQIDSNVIECVPFENHLPEYFFTEDFQKEVSAKQNLLNTYIESKHTPTKKRLIEITKEELKKFKENAKEIARNRLNQIEKIKQIKTICANTSFPLHPIEFIETC